MPFDIASGTVYLDYEDLVVPGKVALIWDRPYSTALLQQPATPLGRCWTSRYFAKLTKRRDTLEFLPPHGAPEILDDPNGKVDEGATVRHLGAFLELFRDGERYVVQRWSINLGEVVRYCFRIGAQGDPWPLSSIEDATGQGLDVTWDQYGRLETVQQRLENRTLVLQHNSSGCIDKVFLRSQGGEYLVARYEHDSTGRQTAGYDAADFAHRYEYDGNDRLIREFPKAGGTFNYAYDNRGRCIKTAGLGRYHEKRLRFFETARVTEVTNSYEHTFQYHYLK